MIALSYGTPQTLVSGTVYALPNKAGLVTGQISGGTIQTSVDNSTWLTVLTSSGSFITSAGYIKSINADSIAVIKPYTVVSQFGSGIQSVYKEFNRAQVLAWPTTPLVIVDPTETYNNTATATKLQIPLQILLRWRPGGNTVIAGIDTPSNITLAWGSDWSLDIAGVKDIKTFISRVNSNGDDVVINLDFNPFIDATHFPNISGGSNLLDNAIAIGNGNAADYTGGNSGAILGISTYYMVWNLLTGRFE
jgi:hypothetical protein